MDKTRIGQIGESSVAQYLTDKKYKILEKNYRTKFGEIDLITRAPDRTLVFVEVKFFISDVNPAHNSGHECPDCSAKIICEINPEHKTGHTCPTCATRVMCGIKSNSSLSPEDNMTMAKIDKFRRIAEYYAGLHPELINERRGYRLDAVALTCPSADALVDPLKLCEFRHYENI